MVGRRGRVDGSGEVEGEADGAATRGDHPILHAAAQTTLGSGEWVRPFLPELALGRLAANDGAAMWSLVVHFVFREPREVEEAPYPVLKSAAFDACWRASTSPFPEGSVGAGCHQYCSAFTSSSFASLLSRLLFNRCARRPPFSRPKELKIACDRPHILSLLVPSTTNLSGLQHTHILEQDTVLCCSKCQKLDWKTHKVAIIWRLVLRDTRAANYFPHSTANVRSTPQRN